MENVTGYLEQMKVEHPEQYTTLMKWFDNDKSLMEYMNPLVKKAIQFHRETKEG